MGGAFSSWKLVGEDIVGKKVRTPKEAIRDGDGVCKVSFFMLGNLDTNLPRV